MSVSFEQNGPVVRVVIDNPPVNALGAAVRRGLMDVVHQTEADPNVQAIILQGKGGRFCAGADVREFNAPPTDPILPDLLDLIESTTKTWIAAIEGVALGGGLELALVCDYRIATRDTQFGFPEVKLGLIPGAGGTVRLPRLIAPSVALGMIAEGEPIKADRAFDLGLVDETVSGDITAAAAKFASVVSELPAPMRRRPLRDTLGTALFENEKTRILRKAGRLNAPVAAVTAVETALTHRADEAFKSERTAFLSLKSDPQSAALRHMFFAEREAAKLPQTKGVKPAPLRHIGVIGGGTMGAGIATACLLSGLSVTMIEQNEDALQAGLSRVRQSLSGAQLRGKIGADEGKRAADALRGATDYARLGDCDLVIEAVFEDMDVKKTVFSMLDTTTRPDAVLATNTSYLDVNEIAQTVHDPSRVIGLHFFSPAHIMKLLELVVTEKASPTALATGLALGQRLGKVTAAAGVCDGFIGNRVMSAYRREADYMIEDGALPHEVDAAMVAFGFPMGVFAMQDLAGLDIAWAMRKRKASTRQSSERYVAIADKLCEAGRFGRKTGKGWYDYSTSKQGEPDPEVEAIILSESARNGIKRAPMTAEEIMTRILSAMQTEGEKILSEGVAASPDVVDVVMVNGYGFPRWRGGPMFMCGKD